MAEITAQYGNATVFALGWNRLRGVEGPAPETGLGFFASSEQKPLALTPFVSDCPAWQPA